MVGPATSYLQVRRTQLQGATPTLLITLPRLRMPTIVVALCAYLMVRAWLYLRRSELFTLSDLLLIVPLCALYDIWLPGRRALRLEVMPSTWRITLRRGFWHMLPGCATFAHGHTKDLDSVEVRPRALWAPRLLMHRGMPWPLHGR